MSGVPPDYVMPDYRMTVRFQLHFFITCLSERRLITVTSERREITREGIERTENRILWKIG